MAGHELLAERVKSVLVVENEILIAMDLEVMLNALGVRSIYHAPTCREALEWLDGRTPDIAILDLHLRDGPGTIVAERLAARGVPFIVYSGDIPALAGHGLLSRAAWVTKPCIAEELTAAIMRTLAKLEPS